LGNREELVKDAISELENDMELLGITGVEGKFFSKPFHPFR
jgi:hypothetical protein